MDLEKWKKHCDYKFKPDYCLGEDFGLRFKPLDVMPAEGYSGRPYNTYIDIESCIVLQLSEYDYENYRAYEVSPAAISNILDGYSRLEYNNK